MAQDVTLDLGTFEISNDVDRKLVLAVATSMSLSLPAGHAGDPTAAQLREQVRAGSLWIARAGSCNFELGINFHSLLDDGLREGLERMVIGAFESFPGWNVLGLEPRREFNSFCDLPDPAIPYSYSIQHIRPNSGLVAPDHVSCAYLSKLSCNLFFEIMGNMAQTIQKQALDQPKKVKTTTLRLPFRKPRRFTKRKPTDDQHEHQYSGRRKRPRMLASNTSPPRLQEAAVDEPELYSLAPELQEIRLESLTHVALNSLFGLKKRFSGVRLTGRAKFPTLLDLTPAVWNARYFQEVVSRTQLAPFISSALGALLSTSSSTLQQKLRSQGSISTERLQRQITELTLRSQPTSKVNHTSQTSAQSSQIADNIIGTDRNEAQIEPKGQDTHYASQNWLQVEPTLLHSRDEEDAVILTSSALQDDNLRLEQGEVLGEGTRPDQRSCSDQQEPISSAGAHRPALLFHSEARQWSSDTRIVLEDEQLRDTDPSAVETHGRAMMQKRHPFQCRLDETYKESHSETTGYPLIDEEYLDEDYLEAEKELAKMLTPGILCARSFHPSVSQNVEDDYDDEFYLATEQELARSVASRYRSADTRHDEFRDSAEAEHMDDNDGNDGFVGEEFGVHGECHQVGDAPFCSYHDLVGGDADHLHVGHNNIREESHKHEMARFIRSGPQNADWAGFGDRFMGIRHGEL